MLRMKISTEARFLERRTQKCRETQKVSEIHARLSFLQLALFPSELRRKLLNERGVIFDEWRRGNKE